MLTTNISESPMMLWWLLLEDGYAIFLDIASQNGSEEK